MGRFCGRLPNNDPARLQQVLDEKARTIGVSCQAPAQPLASPAAAQRLARACQPPPPPPLRAAGG